MSETEPAGRKKLARKVIIDLSIMTVIGVGLAFIGPFGSFEQPLAYRLVSWLGFAYLGYCVYSPMGYVVGRAHDMLHLPVLGLWIAAVLLATIPMTIAIWSIGFLPGPIAMPSLEQGLTSYLHVLVVGSGVTALFYALEARGKAVQHEAVSVSMPRVEDVVLDAEPAPNRPSAPRFFDRLPLSLGTDLIALEMEDHYVRAHTAMGSDLILLRMRDAVAELDQLDGAQVHRSWWVARAAVQGTKREGRNIRLLLANDLEAPVSRGAAPQLKQDGWL